MSNATPTPPTPEVPQNPEEIRRLLRTKILKDGIARIRAELEAAKFEQDLVEVHTYHVQQVQAAASGGMPSKQISTTVVDDAQPMPVFDRVGLACVALQATVASMIFPILPSPEARDEVRKVIILNLSPFIALEAGSPLVLPGQAPPPGPPPGRDGGLIGPFGGRMGPMGPRRIK